VIVGIMRAGALGRGAGMERWTSAGPGPHMRIDAVEEPAEPVLRGVFVGGKMAP